MRQFKQHFKSYCHVPINTFNRHVFFHLYLLLLFAWFISILFLRAFLETETINTNWKLKVNIEQPESSFLYDSSNDKLETPNDFENNDDDDTAHVAWYGDFAEYFANRLIVSYPLPLLITLPFKYQHLFILFSNMTIVLKRRFVALFFLLSP